MMRMSLFLIAVSLFCGVREGVAQEGPYVASQKGTVYYWTGCNAWKRLAPGNRIYFESAEQAKRAGYKQSRSAGCAGPEFDKLVQEAAHKGEKCVVTKIVDGDTIHCEPFGSIRLLLIDAPEMKQGPYGQAAKEQVERLLILGDTVALEFDVQRRDRYRRVLAYVWLRDGRMINRELARSGVAVVSIYQPNVKYVELMRAAVDSAKSEGLQLWSGSAFECLPSDFRAAKCK